MANDNIYPYGTCRRVQAIGPWHAKFIVCGEENVHPSRVMVTKDYHELGWYDVYIEGLASAKPRQIVFTENTLVWAVPLSPDFKSSPFVRLDNEQ